jgi:hypothetical protein
MPLAEDQRPQLVIFIDGLNDFETRGDVAQLTSVFEQFVASGRAPQPTGTEALLNLAASLPIVRITQRIVAHLFPETEPPVTQDTEAEARAVLDRYLGNKKMIEAVAATYNVNVAFVWQPVPMVGYDLNSHLFAARGYDHDNLVAIGHGLLGNFGADNFLRCDGMQQDRNEPLRVKASARHTPNLSSLGFNQPCGVSALSKSWTPQPNTSGNCPLLKLAVSVCTGRFHAALMRREEIGDCFRREGHCRADHLLRAVAQFLLRRMKCYPRPSKLWSTGQIVSDSLGCRSVASGRPMDVEPVVHSLPAPCRLLQLLSQIDAGDLALV